MAGVAVVTLGVAAGANAKDALDNTISGVQEPTSYSYQSDYADDERTAGLNESTSHYNVKGTADADNDGQYGDVNVDVHAQNNSDINVDLQPSEVAEAQEALNDNGFRVSIDGIVGPETRGAVRSFQTSKDMPVTGDFTPQTLAALNVISMEEIEQRWEHNKM